jgi:hypothetical protein
MTSVYTNTKEVPLEETVRFLTNIGAKFAGRALYMWGAESRISDPAFLGFARKALEKVHNTDPELVVQAGIFEIVTEEVNNIPIPGWVFDAFSVEPVKRNFSYAKMLFPDGHYVDHMGAGGSIPDVTQLETQMWIYFLAVSYIKIGVEALHLGQVELMGERDIGYRSWWNLVSRIREFAHKNARRHYVLCDAHVRKTHGIVVDGKLMLDFHSRPLRGVKEIIDEPLHARLEMNYLDSIFGHSKGGITPSGWVCENAPYLVEFDNWGVSGQGGQLISGIWIWGYDEISWFAHLEEDYRNYWLRYAWQWIRENDSNGHLQMPGCRGLSAPANTKTRYYANIPSEACPDGFNQEEAIKAIWKEDRRQASKEPSYEFDGLISRETLNNYLSRAVTQTNLLVTLRGRYAHPDVYGHY